MIGWATCYQLIRQLKKAFVEEGGLREHMTRARLAERARQRRPIKLPGKSALSDFGLRGVGHYASFSSI